MTRSGATALLLWIAGPVAASAQGHPIPLPLPEGSVVVRTLTFTGGDRESFLSLQEVSDKGSRYRWEFREVLETGDTINEHNEFFEGMADVRSSARFLDLRTKGSTDHRGYTMMAISRATYRRLLATRSDTFQVMTAESSGGGSAPAGLGWLGRGRRVPARYRGTISLVAADPGPFPLLVGGQRVEVPALHLRAALMARGRRWAPELWVLADTTYPLVLKWIGASDAPENVLQTVRVDLPADGRGQRSAGSLEGTLRSSCRVELPGIYFAFNSAELYPASDAAIATLAEVLSRHPDWTGTIEGHTDSVGTSAANLALSERRAAALRDRLVSGHKVNPARLDTRGFGSSRPRESNSTIEGRARNRRVELVRTCAGR